jgi:hypothetical protein
MATGDNPNDDEQGTQPFNIDMDIPTTLPQDRGSFGSAKGNGAPVKVKRSTFLIRMPMRYSRGILIKRLATIILPRHKHIAFLPHTSSTHDKLTDHELVPTDDLGIKNYIFDEKTSIRNRGNRNEFKMLECKLQVESPISLYQIKGASEVMELLQKNDIYITAKSYCKAVNTKAVGLLMNLDAKRCAKNKIIETLKNTVDQKSECDVFVDLVPHRGLVRIGKKVIFGQFLKVMVDVAHATMAAKFIQEGLKNTAFGVGMKNVRLMPVYPIPNLMSAEVFGKMILAHNDSMYGIAEIQIDNIWDIDKPSCLPDKIKKRFNLPDKEINKNDQYTLRDIIMPIFWGHYQNQPVVRDVYIMRGRLMVVCEKDKVAETTKLVDMLFDYLKAEYDVPSDYLLKTEDKFAEWVGCSTPKNANRHPARSGTLVFGEGGLLKATVNSFLDHNLDTLPAGLVPAAGHAAKKPDLSRPPPTSLLPRGRTYPIIDPTEFTSNAVTAWASAKTWATITKPKKGKMYTGVTKKQHKAPPTKEIIEIDAATNSTVTMTSGTQSALNTLRTSIHTLEAERKRHNEKISQLDNNMAQIAQDVTKLSDAQRQSANEFVQIKEQIVNIARDNGAMKKEMLEMKDMIMCIANHLGGVRSDNTDATPQELLASPTQNTTQSTVPDYSQQDRDLLREQEESQSISTESDKDMVEDDGSTGSHEEVDPSRKKHKQTHPKVFDTQTETGKTNPRAYHPQLVSQTLALSNGSDSNHSTSEVGYTSMHD